MSKKKKLQAVAPKMAAVTPELALKVFACLESLAEHDTYESEYDGQMMTMCHDCGWLEREEHNKGCKFLEAKDLIKQGYGGAAA
jgi:hypothetical protein